MMSDVSEAFETKYGLNNMKGDDGDSEMDMVRSVRTLETSEGGTASYRLVAKGTLVLRLHIVVVALIVVIVRFSCER